MENAGLLRRLGAMIYDGLLVLAVLFLVTLPFVAVRGGEPVEPDDNLVYQLTVLAAIYAFFTGFWTWSGRTLGMQSWRLRLETAEGQIPSFSSAVLRFFAAILSWLVAPEIIAACSNSR